MVNLQHDVHPVSFERAVGAFEHPHLPQRSTAINGQAAQRSAHLGEFSRPTGLPQCDAVHVTRDVEVGVANPGRMVEIEDSCRQLLLKRGHRKHPHAQFVEESLIAVTAGNRRGVEFQYGENLHGLVVGLEIEEAGIEAGEPLRTSHDPMLRAHR